MLRWTVVVLVMAVSSTPAALNAGSNQWEIWIGMYNDYPWAYSDWSNWFGVEPGATDRFGGWDMVHPPIEDPAHDAAWIFVADQGGDGGWNDETGEFEEYPGIGLERDLFAPFGPGTDDPQRLTKVWAVEVHAPNMGYTWDLRWHFNYESGWEIPGPPFAARVLPNETFPDGLDLTAYGEGVHYIYDLPQWGPEPRIWLIEAGIIPEPGLTFLVAAVPFIAIALRRRFGVR